MFRFTIGDGIEVRQFALEEAPTVFAVVERHREYLRRWLPWVDQSDSPDDVLRFISGALAQFESGLGPSAGIWQEGAFIGSIGCHAFDLPNHCGSLGYWIAAGHQGHGTITRCCVKMVDYLFDECGLHRVEIRCGTGNVRSSAIPRRLGFTQEGLLREAQWVNDHWVDLEVWSMLRQNWRTPD